MCTIWKNQKPAEKQQQKTVGNSEYEKYKYFERATSLVWINSSFQSAESEMAYERNTTISNRLCWSAS